MELLILDRVFKEEKEDRRLNIKTNTMTLDSIKIQLVLKKDLFDISSYHITITSPNGYRMDIEDRFRKMYSGVDGMSTNEVGAMEKEIREEIKQGLEIMSADNDEDIMRDIIGRAYQLLHYEYPHMILELSERATYTIFGLSIVEPLSKVVIRSKEKPQTRIEFVPTSYEIEDLIEEIAKYAEVVNE